MARAMADTAPDDAGAPAGPTLEQPLFEYFGIRIFSDGTLQQFAFDRQANAIRRLVALAVAPEPVGRIERSKQSGANLRRTNY